VHGDDDTEDNWDDFDAMIKDMQEHVKNNGLPSIRIEDRPFQLRFGWRCLDTNKTWSIKIKTFKKYCESLEISGDEFKRQKAKLLKQAIMTQDGKLNLLAVINGI